VLISARSEVISILSTFLVDHEDALIQQIRSDAEAVKDLAARDFTAAVVRATGAVLTRDTTALSQGLRAAPHERVYAEVFAVRSKFQACSTLAEIAKRGASHISRLEASRAVRKRRSEAAGDLVAIGHGRSLIWLELHRFIRERLNLACDEFNRVAVAGIPNTTRLSGMLDVAGIAFLVCTAEDEMADRSERARQNVVHEAGLFQGRLGFSRAIVMLEEGCEQFSNIEGLGQLRFPKGQINARFEDVRQVLEREGFIDSATSGQP